MPNDPKLLALSPSQELWLYAHIKRSDRLRYNQMYDLAQLLCAFISPMAAQNMFTKPQTTENEGFLDDLKKLDPNFDPKAYADFIEEPKG